MKLNKRQYEQGGEDVKEDEQLKRLRQENEFVKNLINLIPPDVYFSKEDRQKIIEKPFDHKNVRKGKKKTVDVKLNERAVTDVIDDLEIIESTETQGKRNGKVGPNIPKNKKQTLNKSNQPAVQGYDQLHSKLESRIVELRGKRPNSEEWLEKRRAARKLSRLRKKKKPKTSGGVEKGQKTGSEPGQQVTETTSEVKPDVQLPQEGGMSFSTVVFSENGAKKKKGALSGRNYSQMLKKVEKEKSKISELEETDKEKAQKLKHKAAWKVAMQRAEGVKVKDDVTLLKKAIMRKTQQKKKSQKEWAERKEQEHRHKERKEEKRKGQIAKRKDEKRKKGIKKAQKEGRYVQPF
jgi:hypothetical protein